MATENKAPRGDQWPQELRSSELTPPVVILKEQAALLGEKTEYRLRAEVVTQNMDGTLFHSFYIVAPSLQNYRYKLFGDSARRLSLPSESRVAAWRFFDPARAEPRTE